MGRFIEGLPQHGVWESAGLERWQFASILTVSVLAFVWLDGPLWQNLRSNHLGRLLGSYGIIVPLAWAALAANRRLDFGRFVGAVVLLSAVKLLLTALILVAIALARV